MLVGDLQFTGRQEEPQDQSGAGVIGKGLGERTSGGGAAERGEVTWVSGVTSLLSVVWVSLGAWNTMPVCLGRGETPEGDSVHWENPLDFPLTWPQVDFWGPRARASAPRGLLFPQHPLYLLVETFAFHPSRYPLLFRTPLPEQFIWM